jgi:O-antigen/teichoic acid export membrane protein
MGIPLMLLANVILARTLSVTEYGTFGFTIALAMVLAIPVAGGLQTLLTREVATYSNNKQWTAYRGLVLAAYGWVAAVCSLIALGLSGWWLVTRDLPAGSLLVAVLLVPFLGLNSLRAGILKGLGRPVMAEMPPQLLQPALMILGYLGLAWLGLSSTLIVLLWYLGVIVAVLGLASLLLWRVQPSQAHHVASDMTDLSRWRRAILPFIMISASSVLSTQLAFLLLGFSGREADVAIMRVAERGAILVALPLNFINTILGPYFVQAMKSEEDGALRRIVRQSARMALAASLPVSLLLLLFGDTLIGWAFGATYGTLSYLPMVFLIAAQVLSVALGPGGMLLAMGGYERQTLIGQLLSLGIILALGWVLIEPFGARGAAISAGSGLVVSQAYFYFMVRRHYGISSGVV